MPGSGEQLRNRVVLCIFVVLSFFYLLIGVHQGQNFHYDEGLPVYGAARVLNGELPYRDFWTIYAPAQFFVLAGLFKLFGPSLFVERIWSTVIVFLLTAAIYLTAKTLSSRRVAWVAWFLALTWTASCRWFANPMPTALLLCLLSVFCLFRFLSERRKLWLFLGGLSVGAGVLFKHEIGFYAFLSESLAIVPFILRNLTSNEAGFPRRFLSALKISSLYFLGIATPVLPMFIWLASVTPLKELVYDLVVFPVTIFPKVRSLPYPAPLPNLHDLFTGALSPILYMNSFLNRLPYYFPLLVYAAVGVTIVVRAIAKRIDWSGRQIWSVILLALMGITFLVPARVRPDALHLIPTLVLAAILFAVLLSHIPKTLPFRQGLWSLAILMCLAIIVKPIWLKAQMARDFVAPSTSSLTLERSGGVSCPQEGAAYEDAARYIQNNVPESERIFVGNTRHDRIFANDIMFYFLCNRHSATKYHELHPGLATTAAIQEKIVSEMEAQQVRYVVLRGESGSDLGQMDTLSGARILDDFIREKFAIAREFGRYSVWQRKVGQISEDTTE